MLAGLALAIPILIHLFNLRRYKTVFFPHTRFLKTIQLNSQKQSQIRYKVLLTLRLLFLASLILAFAQPFFNQGGKKDNNTLNVIYIDNSASMTAKKGARTLLDVAKELAAQQIRNTDAGAKFLLLTNNRLNTYNVLSATKALTELQQIDVSAGSITAKQVLESVENILRNESLRAANLFYYSDFQQNSFLATAKPEAKNIEFYGIPVQAEVAENIFVDTAYLTAPVLQTGQSNALVVRSKAIGKVPAEAPVLQLSMNGQVKTATALNFDNKGESIDTLIFQVNDTRWQKIDLVVNDASVRFDDTFRLSARSAPNLSVLVLNEGQSNPFIQAAFKAYNGFRLSQTSIDQLPENLREYNLIILNGIKSLSPNIAGKLNEVLERGSNIAIFPGKTANTTALNEGLAVLGDIKFTNLDTSVQTISSIQQGSPLVRDMFERIPENVQLPVSNWHYNIEAGLTANQQSVLSFRSGNPFLAIYTPSKGQLYIAASSADAEAGNFTNSYFFVPFLYQMAVQSHGGDVFALTAGSSQTAYLPVKQLTDRTVVHLYGSGLDVIPPQRTVAAGVEVNIAKVQQQAGFYTLAAAGADTSIVAINQDRAESYLATWDINTLKKQWKSDNIHWLTDTQNRRNATSFSTSNFPLWKVCAILALLMLLAETYVLAGGFRKQHTAI